MSDTDEKPRLPGGGDQLVDLGPCEGGKHHVLALKEGRPVAVTHMRQVEDGQSLPQNGNVYWVDEKSGRVIDSMRVGNGPAQVATETYRDNWEAIFGAREPNSEELN